MPAGIEFDSDSPKTTVRNPIYASTSTGERGIVGWLVRKGVVRNKAQAGYILVAIIVVNAIVMWIAFRESLPRIGGQGADPILETVRSEENLGPLQRNAV